MNETTLLLREIYNKEVTDIRRVAHYSNPELDLEDIIKRDVRHSFISDHYNRFMTVTRLFYDGMLETGEDYFYASFILSQEEDITNYALGCLFATVAQKLGFLGNDAVPDVDTYVQQLKDAFYTKVTGLEG